MNETQPRAMVDAIIARDGLNLSPEDYEWFVQLYQDIQPEIALLYEPGLRDVEPAPIYPAF